MSFVDSSVKTRSGVQNRNSPFHVSDVVIEANNDRDELRRQSIIVVMYKSSTFIHTSA